MIKIRNTFDKITKISIVNYRHMCSPSPFGNLLKIPSFFFETDVMYEKFLKVIHTSMVRFYVKPSEKSETITLFAS